MAKKKKRQPRVFISGPITNDPDYELSFRRAECALRLLDYFPMNPVEICRFLPPETTEWDEYMKLTLASLSISDYIYLLDGWEESKGARIEKEYADKLGIKELEIKIGV